jgi:hypothetical protein
VQPVLDRACVECHDQRIAKGERKVPDLRGDRFGANGWSAGFAALKPLAWGRSGGNGIALKERQYSIPGDEGARASKLFALLQKGHYDVKLSAEDLRRVTLWLDANSTFYGAYHDAEAQARGEIVRPALGLPPYLKFEQVVR